MKRIVRTTFNKDIPSNKKEVKRILYEAMDFFQGLQQTRIALPVDEFYFRLVLDELLENALAHGNRYDESKRISVNISVLQDGINISVRDDGSGFHPDRVENPTGKKNILKPSGRGLHLLRHIGELTWNEEGNTVSVRVK